MIIKAPIINPTKTMHSRLLVLVSCYVILALSHRVRENTVLAAGSYKPISRSIVTYSDSQLFSDMLNSKYDSMTLYGRDEMFRDGVIVEFSMFYISSVTYWPIGNNMFRSQTSINDIEYVISGGAELEDVVIQWNFPVPIKMYPKLLRQATDDNRVQRVCGSNNLRKLCGVHDYDGEFLLYLTDMKTGISAIYDPQSNKLCPNKYSYRECETIYDFDVNKELYNVINITYTGNYMWQSPTKNTCHSD